LQQQQKIIKVKSDSLIIDADSSGSSSDKPLALVVFLENVGHIVGLDLPYRVTRVIDWIAEEYGKVMLRFYGAYQRYDKVIILEDADATGINLSNALLDTSKEYTVDVLLLVHGHEEYLVGHMGTELVGAETFGPLAKAYKQDSSVLDLRMVYGLNCHGASLAEWWLALGAKAVNGAAGINWMPEPSLSVFLENWLRGVPYGKSVRRSNNAANSIWGQILRPKAGQVEHPAITSSYMHIYGNSEIKIT